LTTCLEFSQDTFLSLENVDIYCSGVVHTDAVGAWCFNYLAEANIEVGAVADTATGEGVEGAAAGYGVGGGDEGEETDNGGELELHVEELDWGSYRGWFIYGLE